MEFIGEPSSGIRMEVPAFERAGDRLRVYVAFRNVGEKIGEFYAPFARGDDAELRAGGEGLRPAAISPNFQDDICPEYPRGQKVCLWLPSAVERGWFEFRLPQDAQPPFVFRFPGFGKVELRTDRPLRGEVWKDLPTGPFPERRWQGDPVVWVRNRAISSIRLGLREIQVAGGTMRVTWELRHPEGLLVIGELGRPGEIGLVDAAGVQAFPREFPEDLKELYLPKGDRRTFTLVYPAPTAAGPVVFWAPYYPLLRWDPDRNVVEEVQWTGSAFALAPTPTPTAGQIARREIEALLGELSQAFAARDFARFRSALAPNADVDGETLERAVAGGGWPLRDPRLVIQGGDFEADRAKDVAIALEVGLEGFPAEDRRTYRAETDWEKAGGRWQITRWEWVDRPAWVALPGRPFASAHFTLIAPQDLPEGTAREVLQELEAAWEALSAGPLGPAMPARVLALYAPDAQTFRALTGRNPQRTLGVAFARTVPRIEDEQAVGWESTDLMMVLNAEGVKGYRADDPLYGRAAVLRHELVHVVLGKWTRPWTPGWLVEGAAMSFAGQPFWRELKRSGAPIEALGTMTYTVSFGHIGDVFGTAEARQYQLASAMAEFVRERFGDEKFLALYRAYDGIPPETVAQHMPMFGIGMLVEAGMEGIAQEATPGFFREILGVDPETFEAEFLKWWKGK